MTLRAVCLQVFNCGKQHADAKLPCSWEAWRHHDNTSKMASARNCYTMHLGCGVPDLSLSLVLRRRDCPFMVIVQDQYCTVICLQTNLILSGDRVRQMALPQVIVRENATIAHQGLPDLLQLLTNLK